MMKRKLYDLAAADISLRFSPYCWRTKLALAHKNLAYDTVPWRFIEKPEIQFSGQDKVPVLVDGKTVIHDSQAIAEYLETTYPNEASLFGDPAAKAMMVFVKNWTELTLHPTIAKVVLPDIFALLDPKDQPYFRKTREAFQGMTIEAIAARRPEYLAILQATLAPLRATLKGQPFLAGDIPNYADHIAYGALRWATMTSSTPLLAPDDPITVWMQAILDTYGL